MTLDDIKQQMEDLSLGVSVEKRALHRMQVLAELIMNIADKAVPGISIYSQELIADFDRATS